MLKLEESGVMVWGWLYTGMGEKVWLYSVTGGRVFWGWLYSDIGWLYTDTGGIAFWDWLYSSGFDMDSKEVEWVGDCNVVVSGIGEREGVCWIRGPTDVDRTWNKHSIMKCSVTQTESVANSSNYLYSLAISTRSRTGEIWPVCQKCCSKKNIPVFMQTQVCISYRSQSSLFEEGPIFWNCHRDFH